MTASDPSLLRHLVSSFSAPRDLPGDLADLPAAVADLPFTSIEVGLVAAALGTEPAAVATGLSALTDRGLLQQTPPTRTCGRSPTANGCTCCRRAASTLTSNWTTTGAR